MKKVSLKKDRLVIFIGLIILLVKKCVIVFIVIVLRIQSKRFLLEEWQVRLVIFFLYFNFIGTIVEILKIK